VARTQNTTSPDVPSFPLLVVDDDRDQAMTFAEILAENGWNTSYATSVREGLEWLQQNNFAVVLCDYNMPGANGLEFLKHRDRMRCAFVMLTGLSDPRIVADALRLDADDFSFKPVTDWGALHRTLMVAGQRLKSRIQGRKEQEKLSQLADWQAWKATFMKRGQEDDMQQLLRMLHVQFNQDANYSQLLDLVEQISRQPKENTMRVRVPIDILELVASALRPVARFSDGIGIAASLLGDKPRLRPHKLGDVLDSINAEWLPKWTADAAKRSHSFKFWVSRDLTLMRDHWIVVDIEPLFKALNELVINAFKHSDPGTPITVNFSTDGKRLQLSVTNRPNAKTVKIGDIDVTGLPREFEQQAFRLFYRLRDEAAITIYGEDWPMGLGLSLVKSVFFGADGEIGVHNELWHLGDSPDPELLVTARGALPLHRVRPAGYPEESETVTADVDGLELF